MDGRLNPDLPRWMMGFPAGWLPMCSICEEGRGAPRHHEHDGLTRTQALRAAGNAVCWRQAVLALDLLEREA